MDRLKVGIIFGGRSEEHAISVKSAQEVARNLDLEKYEPVYLGITRSGAWKLCDGPDAHWENGGGRPAVLSPDSSVGGVLVLEQGRYETIRLDVVLPVLHGKLGEDGAMQGLLENLIQTLILIFPSCSRAGGDSRIRTWVAPGGGRDGDRVVGEASRRRR